MPTGSHFNAGEKPPDAGCEQRADESTSPGPGDRRPVRSYVRRSGRMTDGQRRALAREWPRYGVASGALLDLAAVFGREAPRLVEVGFGMGDALVDLAVRHPEWDFLGCEVYEPGIGRALSRLAALDIDNVRVVAEDAMVLLERALPAASIRAVLVFFPDPWPKKRHHKRRLVQPPFVAQVARVLEPGGLFELATDWEDYAQQILAVVEAHPGFRNRHGKARFASGPLHRPATKFQRRGEKLGHRIRDMVFEYRPGTEQR